MYKVLLKAKIHNIFISVFIIFSVFRLINTDFSVDIWRPLATSCRSVPTVENPLIEGGEGE